MVAYAESHKNEDLYYSPILYGDAKNTNGAIARTPENALTTQVIYSDSDTAKPSDFRLAPSIVVTTSVGRYHCYWSLINPIGADVASEIAHRLTTAHVEQGSDPSGWSQNKILRIPYSKNMSHGFPEDVKVYYSGEVYDDSDVSGVYDDVQVVKREIMRVDSSVVAHPESLPDYGKILDKSSDKIIELALAEPKDGHDRSKLRYKLLLELFREGTLTHDEVLSVAWHSPAARKWSVEDPRGLSGLIAEANKAFAEVEHERGSGITPPDDDEHVAFTDTDVILLTDEERAAIANEKTFITRYVEHAATRVAKQNLPYDTMNAWTILSCATSQHGFIPRKNGREGLNGFFMTLGETTSGKSAARKFMLSVLKEIFLADPGFNIGGNPSPSALGKKLLERDGKVSWFNKDEAHGAMKGWVSSDWQSGLLEALADLYDGRVDAQLRTGDWENSAKSAQTHFIMHLMGTPKAMIELLNRDLFLSGFLARFVWSIGWPREVTYDSMAENDSDGEDVLHGYDPYARQLAAELVIARRLAVTEAGQKIIPVYINEGAAKRLQDAKWGLNEKFQNDPNFEILQPALVRMGVMIRKAASMLALSEGLSRIQLRHILLALQAAEEWTSNLASIAQQIVASDFQRACDKIEDYLASRPDGEEKRERVTRNFREIETFRLDGFIASLVAQGRVRIFRAEKGGEMLGLKR